MKRVVAGAILGGAIAVLAIWLAVGPSTAPADASSAPTIAAATVLVAPADNATAARALPQLPPSPSPVKIAPPLGDVATPRATVQTQIDLLLADRDVELRETFLPAVREQLTPDVLAFCKQKVRSHPVRPDWEMAEDGVTGAGERERRVSMFGKSMTGFVEVSEDRWLADGIWCVQGRLP